MSWFQALLRKPFIQEPLRFSDELMKGQSLKKKSPNEVHPGPSANVLL